MEEENTEEVKEEVVSSTPLIDSANKTTAELKEQLDRKEDLLRREEALQVTNSLGGQSSGGSESEEKKEDTPKEYMDKVMSGELNGKQ